MPQSLKTETAKGIAWSAVEKFASGGIQFLANIVLARILSPNDFGLLAMISIFIQISQTFIDSGFSNALIQRKNRTQADYSTVFYFNLFLSFFFYVILFLIAPLIAEFFNNTSLVELTRIVGLNLIIGALASVHRTKLTIDLRFKFQSVISLVASIISAIIGVVLAYNGAGVWALVWMSMFNLLIQTILIYVLIKWTPSLIFSKRSFHELFSYSSKLLGASLIHLLYRNLYPIIIGRKFSSVELGYFNRADLFAAYPAFTLGSVISKVSFPIFSRIQDETDRLRAAYSKYITFSSYIIFPLMVGMMVVAKPLILFILTDKWIDMIPMLQILSIDWMTDHLCQINLNILYVKKRSDLAFKLEIIKKSIAIIILFGSLHWGIIGVCWGRAIYGTIAVIINAWYSELLIGLSIKQQFKDISLPLILSLLMGSIVFVVSTSINDLMLSLTVGIITGIILYISLLLMFERQTFMELLIMIKKIR